MFQNVAHLSLDLRNNRLEKMSPNVLYKNGSDWERVGTRILQGQFLVLKSSCKLPSHYTIELSVNPFVL